MRERWPPQPPINLGYRRRRSRWPAWALLLLIAAYLLVIFVGVPLLITWRQ